MPGTSRLPISLRGTFTTQKRPGRYQILAWNIEVLRNVLLVLFLLRWTRKTLLQLRAYGLVGSAVSLYSGVRRRLYGLFLRLPGVRDKVEAEVAASILSLEAKLVPSGPGVERHLRLPAEGWSAERVRVELEKLGNMEHTEWEKGRVSGAVYHGGKELVKLQTDAYGMFAVGNPIHPDVFPGVRKMEAEVVAMVLSLFNAPEGAAGVTTSGGTESILMAVLSARQKAYHERGVTEPEVILPSTAHTAFHKACSYFSIKLHLVPCPAPAYRVSIPHVSRLINRNTILLVGSAPNFPHGIIDDISALSRLAVRHKLPLHVDCCLGSFLMPFLARAGFETAEFDFRVKGVTSISVDTHKYGFAPKGNSTLLYRTTQLRAYQYFISPDWSGGVYASPSIAGSRPGALIAGCWASLMSVGEDGYAEACHRIVGAAKRIEEALRTDDVLRLALKVIGKPLVSVVAFRSASPEEVSSSSVSVSAYDVADRMTARGWHLNALQDPPAVHVAVTLPLASAVDDLLADLRAVVTDLVEEARKEEEREQDESANTVEAGGAKQKKNKKKQKQKKERQGDAAALYGVAGSLPDKSVVVYLARGFLDTLYKA